MLSGRWLCLLVRGEKGGGERGREREREGEGGGGREREGGRGRGREREGGRGRGRGREREREGGEMGTDLVCNCNLSPSDCLRRTCKSATVDLNCTFSSFN